MASLTESARGLELRASESELSAVEGLPEMVALSELLASELANGWDLLQVSDLGGLSEAPVLSQNIVLDDDGRWLDMGGPLYVYLPYQVRSPLDDIKRHGVAIFSDAGE